MPVSFWSLKTRLLNTNVSPYNFGATDYFNRIVFKLACTVVPLHHSPKPSKITISVIQVGKFSHIFLNLMNMSPSEKGQKISFQQLGEDLWIL